MVVQTARMRVKHAGDFAGKVKGKAAEYPDGTEASVRTQRWLDHINRQAADKLTRRIGWFTSLVARTR